MDPTLDDISAFLKRVRYAVDREYVVVTRYAAERASEDLEWDEWDILEQLKELHHDDHLRCEASKAFPNDLIWVFTPDYWDGGQLWIRLVERDDLIVVSFHRA